MTDPTSELKDLIRTAGLEEHESALLAAALPAIRIDSRPGAKTEAGKSRFGGTPDLPNGVDWPRNTKFPRELCFLAQVRLDELPDAPGRELLPDNGMLWFFYDVEEGSWGFQPGDAGSFAVLYHTDLSALELRETPQSVRHIAAEYFGESVDPFRATPISFSPMRTLAPFEETGIEPTDEQYEALEETMVDEEGENIPHHYLLGHPMTVQGDMKSECQFVTNGMDCGGLAPFDEMRAKQLEPGIKDWMLLLQLDTQDEGPGFMWGDCGRLYFWIRKQDLAARDFSKVWCILQCY